jgi:hypothetical protein
MSYNDLKIYFYEKKYGFLVVQAFNEECYGFNLKHIDERATAKQIIR